MGKTFSYYDRSGNRTEGSFEPYRNRNNELLCAVNYIDNGNMQPLTHAQYDDTASRFNGLQDRWQKQMIRQAKWEHASEQERGKLQDPAQALGADEKKEYLAALVARGLDQSDRHLTVVRDMCFKNGQGRHETVYSVGGRPVFEGSMTENVISFSLGTQSLGDVTTIKENERRAAARAALKP